ncbi:PAS domain-containing protein [Patescibacteria group bacterium]|nr:PAS domain-containing protein [Patescibacteria group bacterium]
MKSVPVKKYRNPFEIEKAPAGCRDCQTFKLLKYIIDEMREGATLINNEGVLEYANKSFFEMVGYQSSEIIGKHWSYWCHDEDLVMVGDKKVLKSERLVDGVCRYRIRLKKKDGTYIPVLLVVSKNVDSQYGIRSLGLISDLSGSGLIEGEYQQVSVINKEILETISTGIITLDKNLFIKTINNRVAVLFDKSREEVRGKRIDDVFPSIRVISEWAVWVLRTKRPYKVDRYKLTIPLYDQLVFVNVRIHPLFDGGGKIYGVVCAFDDVTGSAELEEEIELSYRKLETTHKKLENLLKRQSDFLADVSHELRTPLTVIMGNIEVALEDKRLKFDELYDVLKLVESEVLRMSKMVEDLMTLTKMEDGQVNLRMSKFAVDSLLKNILSRIDRANKGNRQVVFRRIEKLVLMADRDRIESLIWNLIDNAIKYTSSNGLVEVDIYKSKAFDRAMVIEVKDNGHGIPLDKIDLIFDRFYRIDEARTRTEIGGSGLGLAICKWIAEAHGGEIRVESKLEKGSKFVVKMPIVVD